MCVHARVFVHAYESGRNCIHACNRTFFEGRMLVENEPPPPAAKAGYGPAQAESSGIERYIETKSLPYTALTKAKKS